MMNWKIISHAMVGTSHLEQGKGCEDVIKAITTEDFAVMAIADGAGSFSKAFEGATIATEKCSKWLLNNFDWAYSAKESEIKYRLLYYTIRKSIIRKAIKEKSRPKEYSSTLLFVAIKDNRYIAGHIGDGVIGIITTEGDNVVLSEPERGEFANNTYFTTSSRISKHFRLHRGNITNISSFFLMSDGSADCLYNQVGNTFAPAISKFAVSLAKASDAEVTQVNDSLKDVMEQHFSSRTNDDCSFIMLQWTNVK
jgi:serine/threonine protein phosphatase PrpC